MRRFDVAENVLFEAPVTGCQLGSFTVRDERGGSAALGANGTAGGRDAGGSAAGSGTADRWGDAAPAPVSSNTTAGCPATA